MTGQLPIVGIAPPLKAAFAPSALGTLAIKARSGASLPSGKLVLIATSKSQTAHWLQDGQVQDGVLTVPMEGFEAVAASAPETDWDRSPKRASSPAACNTRRWKSVCKG